MALVASVDGFYCSPNHAAYGVAKAGVVSLNTTMAREWGEHGMRVKFGAPKRRLPRLHAMPAARRLDGRGLGCEGGESSALPCEAQHRHRRAHAHRRSCTWRAGAAGERRRRETADERLQSTGQGGQQLGVLNKDLEAGLIDFHTLYRGTEVYLCWKMGETGIQFWHAIDAGFRVARPAGE